MSDMDDFTMDDEVLEYENDFDEAPEGNRRTLWIILAAVVLLLVLCCCCLLIGLVVTSAAGSGPVDIDDLIDELSRLAPFAVTMI